MGLGVEKGADVLWAGRVWMGSDCGMEGGSGSVIAKIRQPFTSPLNHNSCMLHDCTRGNTMQHIDAVHF